MPASFRCPHCSAENTLTPGQRFCSVCRQPLFPAQASSYLQLAAPTDSRQIGEQRSSFAVELSPAKAGRDFVLLDTRSAWTTILLALALVVTFIALCATLVEMNFILRLQSGSTVSQEEARAIDTWQSIIAWGQILTNLAMLIAFFAWVYQANRNLWALGVDGLKFTPGWAVGWFIVPLANFWQPFRVVKEIWRASASRDGQDSLAWQWQPVPTLIGFWWACWLLDGLLDRVVIQLYRQADSLANIMTTNYFSLISEIISIVGYALLIAIIRQISTRQATKYSAAIKLRTAT